MSQELSDLMQESKPIDQAGSEAMPKSATNETEQKVKAKPAVTADSQAANIMSTVMGILGDIPSRLTKLKLLLTHSKTNNTGGTKAETVVGETSGTSSTSPAELLSTIGNSKPKVSQKVPLIIVSLVLLIGIFYLGGQVINTLRTNGILPDDGFLGNGNGLTPTLTELPPAPPSIYSKDEMILRLEEDINTLDGQLSSTVLKENSLDPPKLDYDIRF